MSRYRRDRCDSDVYHVTARGVNQQIIFEEERDRHRLFNLLQEDVDEFGVELYAWCFMQNHVHLLPHCSMETLSRFMEHILKQYAKYFNWHHGREGHLFQRRFFSKPVETDDQLVATIRYIHQNPIEVGVTDLLSYRWGSYREYLGVPGIVSTEFPMKLFGDTESFVSFHKKIENDRSLEPGQSLRMRYKSDDEAIAYAKQVTGLSELSQIASSDKKRRDELIARLRENGLTIAQISRITGISKSVVQRAH